MADNGNMLTMDIKINSSLPNPLREEKSFLKGLFGDIRKLQYKSETSYTLITEEVEVLI